MKGDKEPLVSTEEYSEEIRKNPSGESVETEPAGRIEREVFEQEEDWQAQVLTDPAAAIPDYESLKFSVRRVMICVVMFIAGVILLAVSKGDVFFIIMGIVFIVLGAVLLRIAKRGLDRYKKENSEWQKYRESEEKKDL